MKGQSCLGKSWPESSVLPGEELVGRVSPTWGRAGWKGQSYLGKSWLEGSVLPREELAGPDPDGLVSKKDLEKFADPDPQAPQLTLPAPKLSH